MSDDIHVVTFDRSNTHLEMKFTGDDLQLATVSMKLTDTRIGIPLEEPVVIPVRCLFALGHLMLMSIRRTEAQYEKEVQEMADRIRKRQHPLGGKDEKDKKANAAKTK